MTIHMVTSRQNTAHITADDDAHLNARMMGDGQYLLTKDWAPTLASASRVNLPVGEWLWNGRYVQISQQESINIGNGVSSGSTRDDLICLHYSRNTGTGVETVTAVVVKGTVNQGIGVPPITTSLLNTPQESYMIIAVVHWAGLTPSVAAFENVEYLPPVHTVNSIVSPSTSDIWQSQVYPSMLEGSAKNGVVEVTVTGHNSVSLADDKVVIGTLKPEYRPVQIKQWLVGVNQGVWGTIRIHPSGNVCFTHFYASVESLEWAFFSQTCTFIPASK